MMDRFVVKKKRRRDDEYSCTGARYGTALLTLTGLRRFTVHASWTVATAHLRFATKWPSQATGAWSGGMGE